MLTNLVFSACEYNHLMSQDYKVALFLPIQVIMGATHFEYNHLMSKNYIIILFLPIQVIMQAAYFQYTSIWWAKIIS